MMFKREPFMIESHQVEHRRMQIIDVYLAVNAIVAEVIGRTVRDATLDAAACHPHGKTVMIMFTTISILRVRCASEFTTPEPKRVVQQAARFEIG